jgi:hypothetical protein
MSYKKNYMSYKRRSYGRSYKRNCKISCYKRSCKRFEEATKEGATREGVIEKGNCSRKKNVRWPTKIL